jgi:hypothetical protein
MRLPIQSTSAIWGDIPSYTLGPIPIITDLGRYLCRGSALAFVIGCDAVCNLIPHLPPDMPPGTPDPRNDCKRGCWVTYGAWVKQCP